MDLVDSKYIGLVSSRLQKFKKVKNNSIENQNIHDESFDVLAHHLVGLSMQIGEVPIDFAHKIITQAYPL